LDRILSGAAIVRIRICTLTTLLFFISGCASPTAIDAEKEAMNKTAIFLGPESNWERVEIALNYSHGLYGVSNIYIAGSGKVIYQTARYAGGELFEKRYVLTLDKTEVHGLIKSFISNDFIEIRTETRAGVPDEGKPDISLTNPQGQKRTISVWTGTDIFKEKGSKEAAQKFKAIHDEIIRIQRQAEERQEPIYAGKYKPGSWAEAKISASAGEAWNAIADMFHLDMAREASHEAARAYKRSDRIEFLVSGRSEGRGDTAKIILVGKLFNPTPGELPVIMYPEDGISPFYAYIIADSKVALKPQSNLLWQTPSYRKPEPLSILVPAGRQIVFIREINLKDYEYIGNPEAKVYWRFNFWDKQMEGKMAVQLPSIP